jgi:hypothetical protein
MRVRDAGGRPPKYSSSRASVAAAVSAVLQPMMFGRLKPTVVQVTFARLRVLPYRPMAGCTGGGGGGVDVGDAVTVTVVVVVTGGGGEPVTVTVLVSVMVLGAAVTVVVAVTVRVWVTVWVTVTLAFAETFGPCPFFASLGQANMPPAISAVARTAAALMRPGRGSRSTLMTAS